MMMTRWLWRMKTFFAHNTIAQLLFIIERTLASGDQVCWVSQILRLKIKSSTEKCTRNVWYSPYLIWNVSIFQYQIWQILMQSRLNNRAKKTTTWIGDSIEFYLFFSIACHIIHQSKIKILSWIVDPVDSLDEQCNTKNYAHLQSNQFNIESIMKQNNKSIPLIKLGGHHSAKVEPVRCRLNASASTFPHPNSDSTLHILCYARAEGRRPPSRMNIQTLEFRDTRQKKNVEKQKRFMIEEKFFNYPIEEKESEMTLKINVIVFLEPLKIVFVSTFFLHISSAHTSSPRCSCWTAENDCRFFLCSFLRFHFSLHCVVVSSMSSLPPRPASLYNRLDSLHILVTIMEMIMKKSEQVSWKKKKNKLNIKMHKSLDMKQKKKDGKNSFIHFCVQCLLEFRDFLRFSLLSLTRHSTEWVCHRVWTGTTCAVRGEENYNILEFK